MGDSETEVFVALGKRQREEEKMKDTFTTYSRNR